MGQNVRPGIAVQLGLLVLLDIEPVVSGQTFGLLRSFDPPRLALDVRLRFLLHERFATSVCTVVVIGWRILDMNEYTALGCSMTCNRITSTRQTRRTILSGATTFKN
jgi:hypothetical protein